MKQRVEERPRQQPLVTLLLYQLVNLQEVS